MTIEITKRTTVGAAQYSDSILKNMSIGSLSATKAWYHSCLCLLLVLCFCGGSNAFVVTSNVYLPPDRSISCMDLLPRQHASLPRTNETIFLANKNGNNEEDDIPKFYIPVGIAFVAFVAFWPLLALVRINGFENPVDSFDVDMFIALKGILESADRPMMGSEIMELPPLTPAEQIVGAIFGPPR
jgi:hypothetical protein